MFRIPAPSFCIRSKKIAVRYAIVFLWHDWRRFLPGVLAVAFSALLTALQAGILWGLIGVVSVPIDNSQAQIWVMYPNVLACDLGRSIPSSWRDRLLAQPEVEATDEYIQGFGLWTTPKGRTELVLIMGCNVRPSSLGPLARLTPEQQSLLTEKGAVVIDTSDRHRLDVDQVGQIGEVLGHRVRVVGFVERMGSLTGPYVVCSLETARKLLRLREDQATYLLARCRKPDQVPAVVQRLGHFPTLSALDARTFSAKSKWHWIRQTKAGMAVLLFALLGLAVGASVTSQTLFAAAAASLREYAVLRALGIPRWRMNLFIMQQSLLVGLLGLAIGIPLTFGMAELANSVGTYAVLPFWIVGTTFVVTLGMAMVSGLFALRSLHHADPATLLR